MAMSRKWTAIIFFIITQINIVNSELSMLVSVVGHAIEDLFVANAGITIMLAVIIAEAKTIVMVTGKNDFYGRQECK